MTETRSLNGIMHDVKIARDNKALCYWTPDELASDMLVIAKHLIVDIDKYLYMHQAAPAKRIRRYSKIMETLGKSFRIQSV